MRIKRPQIKLLQTCVLQHLGVSRCIFALFVLAAAYFSWFQTFFLSLNIFISVKNISKLLNKCRRFSFEFSLVHVNNFSESKVAIGGGLTVVCGHNVLCT